MGVDQTSLDRIRNATFPASRRGYDKGEVEKFLSRLADWLETGGGDESRSETVKRELERVGERTGAILAQAEESAQQIRAEAEQEAREAIDGATKQADQSRKEADAYSEQTRTEADTYSEETRKTTEDEAAAARAKAEQEARDTIADAQAQARRIVDEGTQRREDIEAVIADLVRRRDDVLVDTEELTTKLTAAVTEHRPAKGADPFAQPDELDPAKRDGDPEDEGEAEDAALFDGEGEELDEEPSDEQDLVDEEPDEPETDEEPEAEAPEEPKEPAKGKKRRSRRRVRS
jgi:DivIVA domain-containing protein